MGRQTKAQQAKARAKAAAQAPPPPPELPPPEARAKAAVQAPPPPPPPPASSAGEGRGAGTASASLVPCSKCGSEGKHFKMESVWAWDDQEAEEGHWLHTCVECIMTREDLPTLQAAQAWIMDNSKAVA